MDAKEQSPTTKNIQRVAAARRALRTYEPYGPTRRRAGQVRDRVVTQVQSLGSSKPGTTRTPAH
jgi:hypothetical protein